MQEKITAFFEKECAWQDCMQVLRVMVLQCGLEETLKWNVPCYMHQGENIVIIHGFKNYCALNFFKGALLKDPKKILTQQTENVQAGRQIRFASMAEINGLQATIKAYLKEAMAIAQLAEKPVLPEKKAIAIPQTLQAFFEQQPTLASAFYALTPGRQRGYLIHFTDAKQEATLIKRVLACQAKILQGKGLYDCTCGLSKRMPQCDGSHKQLRA